MKLGLPRGFNPVGRPSFQTRGNNNRVQVAGRGKKTPMKVFCKFMVTFLTLDLILIIKIFFIFHV